MASTDIKLTSSHDIDLSTGDLNLFSNIENLAVQMVKINLLLFKGEWFRDVSIGIPYIQEIFGNKDTKSAADANIKSTILNTDNIRSITNYTSTINPSTRTFLVIFSAITDSGEILNDITVEI